jgi:hypothetical protein
LYTITWNEGELLSFFFRHYQRFVSRFIVYDDGSDDGTAEFLRSRSDVDLRRFRYSDDSSFVVSQKTLFNDCWKESRNDCDWVIVTDIDEHIYHPRLGDYLGECRRRGVTFIPALGYNMISERSLVPDRLLSEQCTTGVPDVQFNKLRIFDPAAIEETNYGPGGHLALPTGRALRPARDELLLLHYKYVGLGYRLARNKALAARLRPGDTSRPKWVAITGYFHPEDEASRQFAALQEAAVEVVAAAEPPVIPGQDVRWWHSRRYPVAV